MRLELRLRFLLALSFVLGCASGGDRRATDGCDDPDGDGWGEGPDCAGRDCNELEPTVHAPEECDAFWETSSPANKVTSI